MAVKAPGAGSCVRLPAREVRAVPAALLRPAQTKRCPRERPRRLRLLVQARPELTPRSPGSAGDASQSGVRTTGRLPVLPYVGDRDASGKIRIEVMLPVMGRSNLDFIEHGFGVQLNRRASRIVIDAGLRLRGIASLVPKVPIMQLFVIRN